MGKSEYTKTYARQYWLYKILDWICLFAPVITYVFIALFDSGITVSGKVSVVGTVLIAAILTVFNIIAHRNLRCIIWIVLIGLYVAFKNYLLPLVIIMAVSSILDDFILGPLVAYYKSKVIASKTIDERIE